MKSEDLKLGGLTEDFRLKTWEFNEDLKLGYSIESSWSLECSYIKKNLV